MKLVKIIVLQGLIAILPLTAGAWGLVGHRVIGGVAEKYLTANTKTAIKKLLGNESVAMASNWGDFIKSDRKYDYLGPWHYINLPPGMQEQALYEYLRRDTATDLYTRLNFIVKELKNKKLAKDKQVFYLKLLIHLAGDVHQPMHTGRPDDKGGNLIKVYWFNNPTNLHRVWDEHLVEYQQLSYTEYVAAINFASAADITKWQRQPLRQWIYESYQIAEKLYAGVKPEDRLTYSYNYQHVELMNLQLLKGGIRLAGLLNDIFGG